MRILKFTIVTALVFALVYTSFAFVMWDLNAGAWNIKARLIAVISFIVSASTCILCIEMSSENSEKKL